MSKQLPKLVPIIQFAHSLFKSIFPSKQFWYKKPHGSNNLITLSFKNVNNKTKHDQIIGNCGFAADY